MRQLLIIAAEEWRYWLRSYLVLGGFLIFALLLIATSLLTAMRIEAENHARAHQQAEAEETFLAQPDRHPHRMVHYGHYVFRTPAPLAIFDPGLDPVTGQSIFLEGHRQNTAMFADSGASADLGGLSWLTPALIYQLFAPLLIILIGHGAVAREREARVLVPLLAQGIKGYTLIFAKALAIHSFIVLLLVPLLINGAIVLSYGESLLAVLSLLEAYLVYLAIWGMLALFISAILIKRSAVLATLIAMWLAITLIMPAIAVNIAAHNKPLKGKIETDFTMQADLRKLGDGHNANDPAFKQLRANLFKQYGVKRIEDLPVNFRGLVASNAEKKLTDVLNNYAKARMAAEARQARFLMSQGWLTPALAIANASRAISGTDLEHYHRFLREAEDLRFSFVQGLNRAHQEKLSYVDDINRNKNEASSQRARVNAANWQVLDTFQFKPATASTRLSKAAQSMTMLFAWLVLMLGALLWSGKRLQP